MNGLRTWIEIDKRAIENNYRIFRKLIGKKCLLMAVVKSNAYGHGLIDFSKLAQKLGADPVRGNPAERDAALSARTPNGADWFGVDSIVEALALRAAGIRKKILVLGYTLPERIKDAAKNNISLTVSSPKHLESIKRLEFSQPLKIHLKIDTGMHRQGFYLDELPLVFRFIKEKNKNNPNLMLEGIYTHFAAAKNPSFPADTIKQIKLFDEAANMAESEGFSPLKHGAATSGAIVFPQSHYGLVRIGIGLYGLWPSKETEAAFRDKINLKPALTWKTIIGEIKNAGKGEAVGYDFTEVLNKPTKIAILPIGYWHGYPRALSSTGRIFIKGKPAKVLGRVSMDMTTVDISGINAKIGDEAVIIGKSGKKYVSADDIADLANTSSYEILSRLNPLIKRIYI